MEFRGAGGGRWWNNGHLCLARRYPRQGPQRRSGVPLRPVFTPPAFGGAALRGRRVPAGAGPRRSCSSRRTALRLRPLDQYQLL